MNILVRRRMVEEDGSCDKNEEHHRNNSIQRKERGVHAAQISGRDDEVLVEQERGDGGHTHPGDGIQSEEVDQPEQQSEHGQVLSLIHI